HTFDLTVQSGYTLNLASVTLSDMKTGGSANPTWQFRYSTDAYAAVRASGSATSSSFASETQNFTGLSSLTAGTYTFRVYAFGGQNGSTDLALDEFSFDGTLTSSNNNST